ncbi:MAG: hypothetical protein E7603_03510 [Ruminococcaceae bacterium]|nr:hypothetical protein [Oscillospiraceae bacterium]
MIYEEYVKASLEDYGRNGRLEERSILRVLEDISSYHSDSLGYGARNIEKTKLAWLLLEWRVKIHLPLHYGESYRVTTWSRGVCSPCTTLRDFEIFDEDGNLCVSASSKWTPVHSENKKILRVTEDLLALYGTETRTAFEDGELVRMKEPKEYTYEMPYHIDRKEIDLNGHLHNLCYLDIALETIPEDIYHMRDFRNIRITYRKEIKSDEKDILSRYREDEGVHTVGIYGKDGKIRAIVSLS